MFPLEAETNSEEVLRKALLLEWLANIFVFFPNLPRKFRLWNVDLSDRNEQKLIDRNVKITMPTNSSGQPFFIILKTLYTVYLIQNVSADMMQRIGEDIVVCFSMLKTRYKYSCARSKFACCSTSDLNQYAHMHENRHLR